LYLVAFVLLIATQAAWSAEKARMRVDDYQIDAELLPQSQKPTAHAVVKITALEDVAVARFQLNISLRIT